MSMPRVSGEAIRSTDAGLADSPATPSLRDPDQVMRLTRLGAGFATRLSVMRSLIRRMSHERWHIEPVRFDLDDEGLGTVVYECATPRRRYSLVGFTHDIDPADRTDRVIAEVWDATFTLVDGPASPDDVKRLASQTPHQESGRYCERDLVLSRANKSVRLFEDVVSALASGRQPDHGTLRDVGYLMRTTAVYGNGKFGMSDRARYAGRSELSGPFRAELLAVYMIRIFTFDLVEHLARRRNAARAAPLDPMLKRHLGIGNATGLGMAPFLVTHPRLLHNWFNARETALARVRRIDGATEEDWHRFRTFLHRAQNHVRQWTTTDPQQSARIDGLNDDLQRVNDLLDADQGKDLTWDGLYRWSERNLSVEGQELLVSLLIELYPDLVDPLAEGQEIDDPDEFDPSQSIGSMRSMLQREYNWALEVDFEDPEENHYFWYSSEEKLEPRRGQRYHEPGAEKEMPLAIARDVQWLYNVLAEYDPDESLAVMLMERPDLRYIAGRVQACSGLAYAEIRDNLIGSDCRPIDMLRAKLAYFGASRFDPKSDLWTRITLYQGAPLPSDLGAPDADDWCFPAMPETQ